MRRAVQLLPEAERFPYLVLYVLEDQHIFVTAVFHGHRDPRRWSDRVREGALRSEILDGERTGGRLAAGGLVLAGRCEHCDGEVQRLVER